MATSGQEMNPTVLDIGRGVSEWVPDTVTELTASPQNSFIAMYGPTKPDIYFYRTFSDGQEEIMQSWFGVHPLIHVGRVNHLLIGYLLYRGQILT